MDYNFIDKKDHRSLIAHLYSLKLSENILPFESIILPLGFPAFTNILSKTQEITYKNKTTAIKGLVITAQYYGTYNFFSNDKTHNIGIVLHPTSLYKIFNIDISLLTNEHFLMKNINLEIANELEAIFLKYKNDLPVFEEKIINFFDALKITINDDVIQIDKAIDLILKKDGLIQVTDLLNILPFSQKSLEIKFKKIIGLTPGKFIRQYRFMNLMQKYQSKKINLTDLIYMFNYYDKSHFIKDFKFFMNQTPKKFFKEDYPLLEEYLSK